MKALIVNADDFGYSYGINKGILEAHKNGIVTSTSVMVNSIAAGEASTLNEFPDLSVGLHFVTGELSDTRTDLDHQFGVFKSLIGKQPTHIDIHKVRDGDVELKSIVNEYAKEKGIPFRYSGDTAFISTFFGPHANGDVSIRQLVMSLSEVTEGLNELMCHVGFVDSYLREHSSYSDLRANELETICSEEVKKYINESGIVLTNWAKISSI